MWNRYVCDIFIWKFMLFKRPFTNWKHLIKFISLRTYHSASKIILCCFTKHCIWWLSVPLEAKTLRILQWSRYNYTLHVFLYTYTSAVRINLRSLRSYNSLHKITFLVLGKIKMKFQKVATFLQETHTHITPNGKCCHCGCEWSGNSLLLSILPSQIWRLL